MAQVSTPSPRRRPTVPPLSELDAPGRGPTRTAPVGDDPAATLWTPRSGADGDDQTGVPAGPEVTQQRSLGDDQAAVAAQRAVADERAAVARAVLAQRAATVAVGDGAAPGRFGALLSGHPVPSAVALGLAALLVVLRLWLVGSGSLFGAVPVHALDATIVAVLALGLALGRDVGGAGAAGSGARGRRLAIVLAVPLLVAAGMTLLLPATPTSAPAAACPAAPVRGAAFVAVTAADAATRSGPGRSYGISGRFPAGCAVGIAGYCLGDPMPSRSWTGWSDSRWLMVDRPEGGAAALVARHLSGEPSLPRFLPSAAVTPAGPQEDLPLLSTAECGRDGLRMPGETAMEDVVADRHTANLSARASRAANIGFAVWVAPDPSTGVPPLLRGEAYQQVTGTTSTDGSGTAGPAGRRTVSWDYRSLIRDLDTHRRTPTVTVAVLAVGCEAPSAPTQDATAAVITYTVTGQRLSPPQQRLRGHQLGSLRDPALRGLNLHRLTTAACQSPL